MTTGCAVCRKKLGLIPMTCRCGLDLCAKHRYPEEHNCKYDFKKSGRQILEQQLIKVAADRLNNRLS